MIKEYSTEEEFNTLVKECAADFQKWIKEKEYPPGVVFEVIEEVLCSGMADLAYKKMNMALMRIIAKANTMKEMEEN